jgi:hypothetical protein
VAVEIACRLGLRKRLRLLQLLDRSVHNRKVTLPLSLELTGRLGRMKPRAAQAPRRPSMPPPNSR